MTSPKPIRCAIYTRKSTEHNLDLEFNSLDAQREACEAYIKSQMHEGWRLIPDHYDDGGISGASLERPDLQRLLADIKSGKIDTVVVYKVDRLTRSLADFAKLVDLFDIHTVSFVSVTQSFNTTTSMGRLTLNVLLSFAQFEREVIGERVRDKIAASKRKGMWMGGPAPLGYINRGKKLVIVPEEAETVRWIFRRYLELQSMDRLLAEMHAKGLRTRATTVSGGRARGGISFRKGTLLYLLKNECYVGEIFHRGESHVADHEPIIERSVFEAVQASFAARKVERKARIRASPFLLTGLLFDSAGHAMSPTHTKKKGVRYRYYVSQAHLQGKKGEIGEVGRVPAPDIEALVQNLVQEHCGAVEPGGPRAVLEAYIQRITVQAEAVVVDLRDYGDAGEERPQTVSLAWSKKPFVAVKGIALEPSSGPEGSPRAREAALTAIGKARAWVRELEAGAALADIASREGKGDRQIRLLVPLAFLSPQTVREVAQGDWVPVTVTELARSVPLVWPSLRAGH